MTESFDLIVIGSGPGGYVAAIRAAQLGLKVACVEKESLGGTCLNVGCIPSKALLSISEHFEKLKHLDAEGISIEGSSINFAKIMERKRKIVTGFVDGIGILFKKNRITSISGFARLISPTVVEVEKDGKKSSISAVSIILASGSEPIALPFLPFDEKRIVSSTGALALKEIPKKLLVVGAGIIGVELGSVYRRLGAEVQFVEFLDRICPGFDEAICKEFQKILEKQGLIFHLNSKVTNATAKGGSIEIQAESQGSKKSFSADVVLVAIGRKAASKNLGLETVGVKISEKGLINVDKNFRTSIPNIYAIGDVIDGPMLAHKASEEGVATAEIITGHHPKIDYLAIPNVVYTSPEVASVGLTEQEAKNLGLAVRTGLFPMSINSRARCIGEEEGFVKILADEKSDRLLGIHIIASHASEMIAEAVVAIERKMTALELGQLVHAHPTLTEAIKEAALALHRQAIHR